MEQFDLVEKIVNSFGVSYEKAREVLEANNWDAVEAAIQLEKEQKGEYSSEGAAPEAEQRGTKGSAQKCETPSFIKTGWDFITKNSFMMKKADGEVFMDLPLGLAVLLACVFPWIMVALLVVLFLMGYRFSLKGPQFKDKTMKSSVYDAADKVEKVVVDTTEKIKNSCAPEEPKAEPDAEPEAEPEIKVSKTDEE